MSSPIHHAKDLDVALVYAPPWARDRSQSAERSPDMAPAEPGKVEMEPVFSGDRAMLELQRRMALDPEAVPEAPPTAGQNFWPVLRRLSIVGCGAALVTSAMMWVIGARPAATTTVAAVLAPSAELDPGKSDRMPDARPQWPMNPARPARLAEASPIVPVTVGAVIEPNPESNSGTGLKSGMATAVPPKPAPPKPDSDPTLQLGSDEIAILVKRGRDYLDAGDFASARLLLRRAAQAGSGEAALVLGMTFDPLLVRRLGALGVAADAAKARTWYQKAAALGSDSAAQHLATLGEE